MKMFQEISSNPAQYLSTLLYSTYHWQKKSRTFFTFKRLSFHKVRNLKKMVIPTYVPIYFTLTPHSLKKTLERMQSANLLSVPFFLQIIFLALMHHSAKWQMAAGASTKRGQEDTVVQCEWRHVAKRHLFASIVIIKDVSSE